MKLSDLILTPGFMIICVLGIGLGALTSFLIKDELGKFSGLFGTGLAIFFIVVATITYYQTVKKRKNRGK